jgi:drug/metabolite transporter (DMT)-like permease
MDPPLKRTVGLDLLLLLMVAIWGANFSIIKYALRDFPELPFNAMRLLVATALFLAWLWWRNRSASRRAGNGTAITAAEWRRIVLLGVVGHFVYQLCFLAGVARTTVSNSSLIFGCTPVTVALMASAAGHERVTLVRWLGTALSLAGLYVLIGRRASWSFASLAGDLLVFTGMLCWSLYSVLSQPLLRRHSPMKITGLSMAIGALFYVLVALPAMTATSWRAISPASWAMMTFSAVFALGVAYVIWYTGVQRLGSARTAIYSNLTPLFAIAVAWVWLDEPVGWTQTVGALAILAGVFVTRFGH